MFVRGRYQCYQYEISALATRVCIDRPKCADWLKAVPFTVADAEYSVRAARCYLRPRELGATNHHLGPSQRHHLAVCMHSALGG